MDKVSFKNEENKKTLQLYETDFNYKVFEQQRKIMTITNQITREETVIAVKLERKADRKYIIDPLVTSFLKDEYWISGASLNTQKKYATVVCSFLNYCRFMIQQQNEEFIDINNGFLSLKFRHGCLYLKEKVERYQLREIKASTVLQMEFPLLRFYNYLLEAEIIEEKVKQIFKTEEDTDELLLLYNPFRQIGEDRVAFPKEEQYNFQEVRDFANSSFDKRLTSIQLMINLAMEHYGDVAFLLCVMFYGGLRLGEAVNLSRQSMVRPKYYDNDDLGEDGFVFRVVDNPELFQSFKTKSNNQVKSRNSIQALEMVDIETISVVYQFHKTRIKGLKERGKLRNEIALFYSSYSGRTLTYHTAYYQFKMLAEKFIDKLVELGDKETLDSLTDSSTNDFRITPHLCRAVFTNLGIDLGYSKEEMKNKRRDRTDTSIQFYWDRKMLKLKRQTVVSALQIKAVESNLDSLEDEK